MVQAWRWQADAGEECRARFQPGIGSLGSRQRHAVQRRGCQQIAKTDDVANDDQRRGGELGCADGGGKLSQRRGDDALLDRAGPERLLWGSDWPFAAYEDSITYAKAVALYQEMVPDRTTRQAIDRTAYDFYFRQG